MERGTDRGDRSRLRLVEAARRVFERDGYLDVGVADIVKEAGVSRGSFYTYFPSKLEVFRVVTAEVAEKVDHTVTKRLDDEMDLDPVDALSRSNQRYIEVYEQNSKIYALIEQLSHMDPELLASAQERRRTSIDRVTGLIKHWQALGLADPSVDASATASALVSMMFSFCRWLFVGPEPEMDITKAAAALNQIWIRSVDLRRRPFRRWLSNSEDTSAASGS